MKRKTRIIRMIMSFILSAGIILNPVADSLYAYDSMVYSENEDTYPEYEAVNEDGVDEEISDSDTEGKLTDESEDDSESGEAAASDADDSGSEDEENNSEESGLEGDEESAEEETPDDENGEDGLDEEITEDSGDNLDLNNENETSAEEKAISEELKIAAIDSFELILAEETLMAVVYPGDANVYADRQGENQVSRVSLGTTVYVEGIEISENGEILYEIYYFDQERECRGYIFADEIIYTDEDWQEWFGSVYAEYAKSLGISGESINKNSSYISAVSSKEAAADAYLTQNDSGYSDINQFPASYREALVNIKRNHPNWVFVPQRTGLDFNSAVTNEADVSSNRSWIQATAFNKEHGFVGSPAAQSGWYYATPAGVAYYMDPRNFLSEDRIFMFEQLTYNSSYHTESAVQAVLSGTFMRGEIPNEGKTYAKAFYEIGQSRKLSPVHLASRVYQEQGQGTSALISGTYPGYVGYYNYFNVGASGSNPVVAGLTYAKNAGWNTRYKSLVGGAQTIGNGYILKGQDTIYYQKYNVSPSSAYGKYTHQYMQNVQAPSTEGYKTWQSYKNAGSLNAPFLFTIPVYENMPNEAVPISRISLSGSTAKLRAPGYISADTTGFTQTDINANTNTVKLNVAYAPANYSDDDTIAWSSDNTDVAYVDADGIVHAVGVGKTTIRAVAVNSGIYPQPTASYAIEVFIPLENITLSETEVVLRRKDTVTTDSLLLSPEEAAANKSSIALSVNKLPACTTDVGSITWKSSNINVATVDRNGVVTAVRTGTAVITATTKGSIAGRTLLASCQISVIAPVYSLNVTNPINRNELVKNESFPLVAKILPADATGDKEIRWTSSDESVLTVDADGLVKAVGSGVATITCSVYRYSVSETFEVKNSSVIFWNEAGDCVNETLNVDFGEKIDSSDYDTVFDRYNRLAGAGQSFVGFFTQPRGRGVLFSPERAIDAFSLNLYPYYMSTECDFYVVPIGDFEYTGAQIRPEMEVYGISEYVDENDRLIKEKVKLTFNKDYVVAYANNVNVNTDPRRVPTITITGRGNFSGVKKINFNILPLSINTGNSEAQDITVNYTGRAIKSAITVTRNGKKLRNGIDYTLSYPSTKAGAYIQPGEWPVVITGKGAYTGSVTATETITTDINMSRVGISRIANQTYDAGGCRPEFTINYGRTILAEGVNYTVEYANNDKIGTAQIIVSAVDGGGYYGSKTFTFRIVGENFGKVKIVDENGLNPILVKDYTGNEEDVKQTGYIVKFPYRVLDENNRWVNAEKTLVEGEDYTVSYVNINKAGNAQIVFTGINAYTGVVRKVYRINQRLISDVFTPREGLSVKFLKGGAKPVIDVYDGSTLLTLNKDYTIAYRDFGAVTTETTRNCPSYTITGRGNYKGTVKGYYTITDGTFDDTSKITMTVQDVAYQKRAGVYNANPVLTDSDGKVLAANRDYKIVSHTYASNTTVCDVRGNEIQRNAGDEIDRRVDVIPAGTKLTVTVMGINNYAGNTETLRSITYRVYSFNISRAAIKVLNKKQYAYGNPVTITGSDLLITYGGVELVEGVDYYIDASTYKNNTNKGNASVTIRAVEDNPGYGGFRTISFQILPKGFN